MWRKLFLCFVAAACSDSEPKQEELIGTWSNGQNVEVTFSSDGEYRRQDIQASLVRGRWEVIGKHLRLSELPLFEGGVAEEEATYRVAGDTLLFPAWLPEGPVNGFAGVWVAESVQATTANGVRSEIVGRQVYEIRPDRSVIWTYEYIDDGRMVKNHGTMAYEDGTDGDLVLYEPQDPSSPRFELHLFAVEGALGSERYVKVAD